MQERGIANVYRIRKSPYQGWTYTPYLGTIHSELPTKSLLREFTEMHAEHQNALYEASRKGLTIQERRKEEQLEQALKPRDTYESLLEKARLIMPQIVDGKKWSDQGRVNMPEMMKLLKVSQNTAYRLRRDILKEYHANDDARAAQYSGTSAEPQGAVTQQQEEEPQ